MVGVDGFPNQESAQIYKNTILVASGETWDVEFLANNPGIWPMHCHMPHHVTNNGAPAVGGMFTTVSYCTGTSTEYRYCSPDWPRLT